MDRSALLAQAHVLFNGFSAPEKITQSCFEFVRDEIKHGWDYKLAPITYKASSVLKFGTGFCYAKIIHDRKFKKW